MSDQREPPASNLVREAIDVRRFPWVRALVGAYAGDFASVATLFAGNPGDPAAWRDTIRRVTAAPCDRAAIASILARQLERRGAPAEAKAAAGRLGDPASVAILTGQQAGLFGGPLYTLLKAITALRIAQNVTRDAGVPAVAVFWVDAEDHDWDEVRTACVLDGESQVREVAMAPPRGAGDQPVGSLVLTDEIAAALNALGATLAPTEFTAGLLADLTQCYQPGVSMTTAFARWLDRLLGRHGLVVYESNDAGAKPLARDIFAGELEQPARTAGLVRTACALMRRLGHEPQVEPAADAVSLFYVDQHGRRAIKREGDDYRVGSERRTVAALSNEARLHPERFSPNVLLRPIVQDQLFPTVCYVGGPAELAYQAELGEVYRAFGVAAPLLYPRLTATLVDAGAARFLDRSGMPLESLHPQDDAALNALLERQLPPAIDAALARATRDVASHLAEVKAAVPAVDPTLAGAVDTTVTRIEDTLKQLHAKIIHASKRKDDTLRRQFARTRALTFPGGEPQERVLNVAFFLNRYGPALCDRLMESGPMTMDKHLVITI